MPQQRQASSIEEVRRRVGPMDPAHRMDWAILDLGHKPVSKRTVNLSDLEVHVWGLDLIEGSRLPIAMIILSHGWANKARDMEPMASGLIGEFRRLEAESGRRRARDVIVATLDQRNHGERRRIRSKETFDSNPARLISAAANIMGGAMDHEYIMNLLPAYLFPRGERVVEEYMCAGFSMGGHVTWRMVREDPRVKIAVPICSYPGEALGPLLIKRAEVLPDKTYLPPSVEKFFLERSAPGTYAGKKILALHGDLDALMPWHKAEDEWQRVAGECAPGESERWVDYDHGHVVSQDMVRRAAEWFWRWGLSAA
ncbi:hypothetical protein CcaverHIS002_0103190 [Cutaneotrichosporon cavernicola]|uniref:Alpha/beta-hydrolase n=1 Tax=Cutaneotrichosporon cavernicola TaxID=279322 RepID=A0AA48I499_9TREE|nr:uncharacterized protein CcaverHIS019_0103130 [Cutaneotrichosporon cavernicola]BEI79790.1 hypothetical protein CcaverHIS002_0103190 [Cutaneotrichosporon cavernicola]BEI87595.1 hypothetical protein CcaverHIS019_0103130 [Cutaneotrichosporon cavernicola]BEI95366.1 hypothetical protein CcaverHIS631_0103150 [Cutaneotrichosporon cavernicola]BEJ03140.1 hypothetical protein CcaverHIS641_0103150 [Cutaneotrichosporon cavernicola]